FDRVLRFALLALAVVGRVEADADAERIAGAIEAVLDADSRRDRQGNAGRPAGAPADAEERGDVLGDLLVDVEVPTVVFGLVLVRDFIAVLDAESVVALAQSGDRRRIGDIDGADEVAVGDGVKPGQGFAALHIGHSAGQGPLRRDI